VRVFDAGAARWRESACWPPPRVAPRRLHLRGDGRAQGADGDGRLEVEPPGSFEPPDRFVYDPADATPSGAPGPRRDGSGSRARRGDVLCYATAPLEAPLLLAGSVRAELHVASDAPATDFCARLVAVDPAAGEAPICEGAARVALPAPQSDSTPRRVVVECGAACWRVGAGSRLRLEIASASHPRFDRATNTLEEPARAADAGAPARQTLFHDAAHPSCLVVEAEP
jgi:putative CocE/NonD family hydrolase